MRIGIVGGGSIVREFLSVRPDCIEVGAIYTRRAEAAQELACEFGIPEVYTSYEELLAADIDFVYIALTNDLHFDFAAQALCYGKNVVLEKPFTVTLEQASWLADIAEKKGLYIFEAISNLYTIPARAMADAAGEIGRITKAELRFMQRSKRYDDLKLGIIHPVFDASRHGGVLMDLGIYCIHLLNYIFGEPVRCEYIPRIEWDVDVEGIIRFWYDDFCAECRISKICDGKNGIYIEGTDGFIKSVSKPNEAASVQIATSDGTREYSGQSGVKRLCAEWEAFDTIYRRGDYAEMRKMLQYTLSAEKLLVMCKGNF